MFRIFVCVKFKTIIMKRLFCITILLFMAFNIYAVTNSGETYIHLQVGIYDPDYPHGHKPQPRAGAQGKSPAATAQKSGSFSRQSDQNYCRRGSLPDHRSQCDGTGRIAGSGQRAVGKESCNPAEYRCLQP